MFEKGTLDKMPINNLVLINAPVINQKAYRFDGLDNKIFNIIQIDSKNDLVSGAGQLLEGSSPISEKSDDADFLFQYKDQLRIDFFGCGISNHCGHDDKNVKIWYDRVKINIQKKSKQ